MIFKHRMLQTPHEYTSRDFFINESLSLCLHTMKRLFPALRECKQGTTFTLEVYLERQLGTIGLYLKFPEYTEGRMMRWGRTEARNYKYISEFANTATARTTVNKLGLGVERKVYIKIANLQSK